MRIEKNATSALSIVEHMYMYEKGLVIGMIISQGGGGPDEVKLGAIIQTQPISFLQRLVMHIRVSQKNFFYEFCNVLWTLAAK